MTSANVSESFCHEGEYSAGDKSSETYREYNCRPIHLYEETIPANSAESESACSVQGASSNYQSTRYDCLACNTTIRGYYGSEQDQVAGFRSNDSISGRRWMVQVRCQGGR